MVGPQMSWAGVEFSGRWGCLWVRSQVHSWRAYLLKVGFLVLLFYCGVSASYLDPKALTKALLSMGGCQICVSVWARWGGVVDKGWGPPILLYC